MNTRLAAPVFTLALFLALGGCATASPQLAASPAFALRGGEHVDVVSGYLRDGPGAVVRGFVRRDPLWRGPVGGHLHIAAYAASGELIARHAATWSGQLAGRRPASAIYQADLQVARADVARVTVTFAPGRHKASETFQ